MTKKELVYAVASSTNLSKKEVDNVITNLFSVINCEVKKGQNIILKGIGTFKSVVINEKKGINLKTKAVITIPKKKSMRFKISKSFKNSLNQ